MERNSEIRKILKDNHLYVYQLAEAAGISEPTIIRWFRTPLNDEHYNRLMQALEELKEGVKK